MAEHAVAVTDLAVRLSGYPVFSGVNLTVAPGEVLAILGDIGAGKSTLLRVLGGRITPSGGRVQVLGRDPGDPDLAAQVALVSGHPQWEPGANVLQVLEMSRMAVEADDETWPLPPRVMEAFELDERWDQTPETLSQGLRQRLALAAAFARPSRLLLADDPEFGLDSAFRPVLAEVVAGYTARGGTVLLATHDLDLAISAKARTFGLG